MNAPRRPPTGPPSVSVVIPAFNAEATLAETAGTALASTYADLELIIVDDGSTDGTAQVARDLAGSDARVRLVQRANGGLPAALNSGFAVARGEYVARLDADDLWHPDKLARQMALARQQPDAAFIYTFYRYVDGEGRVIRDGPPQRFPPRALCRGIWETIIGTGSSVLMKRSAITQAGGCDETWRTWEDLLLQLKISARHPIAFLPEYLVGYRVQPNTLSQNMDGMLGVWLQLHERIRRLFPQAPSFVHDWGHAARCAEMAEIFAWRGDYRRTATLLATAFRHDPAWTSRLLSYRSARHLRRRFAPPRPRAPGPCFFDCDPAAAMASDPFGPAAVGGGLQRLQERRRQQLAELDERVAAALPNAAPSPSLPAAAAPGTNRQAPDGS